MHGRACEERKRGRHMWTAPSRATASVKAIGSSSSATSSSLLSSSLPNSFFKDGRKISVGDCALFKPPQDCPPFIGIIRSVTAVKENQLNLGVNWLYRPAEVKLGKGILLDAAPNEIFYSFHKDEIPAASLLHPCKVAFLPKGVELPSGICSFVCWRVYDITHKCLWWLTDQDYIDERQEEVDQLLSKTRLEMHATVQQGGRSPKPMNGPTSTSQLKTSSDSVHNTGSSFPSQVKGKKRERTDQGSESVKRERIVRVEDTDSVHIKLENTLRSEIAKITEKGGLVDSDGVEKLVQLMVPEGSERKIDLASRSVLAGVVAATDKFDCLSRFVQLRGLPVFDEWLQEVHKGKMGDSSSPKHGDRSIEEFLLILLRALDKLPVNLHALQMCNIGKSVNLLRSHKNVEIQRKARSLVDTWKKRVEAEMDAKSSPGQGVSWSARPRLPEASHGTTKTSVSHPHSSKSSSVKLVQGENSVKSASPSPGSTRSALSPTSGGMNMKDGQQKNFGGIGMSDVPPTSVRDEKSSSSSPSHNNSQSYSSDHAKTGGTSGKEDPRCPSTGSLCVNKSSGGSSRHRRSANGFQGSASSTGHRETGSVKNSSISKNNSVSEKVSQSNSICEKVHELPASEGSAHKLIVKIPNRGRSPTQATGTTSVEDATVLNRTSSPVLSEKDDQVDQNQKEKTDTYRTIISSDVHNESWQSNDSKDVQAGSVEGGGSPSIPNEERSRTVDAKKPVEAPKACVLDISKASSPHSVDDLKPGKPHENPFGSIYALIESCVKYSEANNAPVAAEDDVGMNLLASVAAGEISKSDMASPTGSPHTNENSCLGNDSKQNLFSDDLSHTLATDGAIVENEKQDFVGGNVESKAVKPITDPARKFDCNSLKQSANQCLESNGEYRDAEKTSTSVSSANESRQMMDDDTIKASKDIKADGSLADDVSDAKRKLSADTKVGDSGVKVEGEICHPQPFSESNQSKDEQKPSISKSSSELVRTDDCALPLGSGKYPVSANVNELKAEKADEMEADHHDPTKGQNIEGESSASGNQVGAGLVSSVTKFKVEHVGENLDGDEDNEPQSGVHCPLTVSLLTGKGKEEHCAKARESRLNTAGTDEADDSTLAGDASSSSSAADRDTKVEFDLNEGFSGDDGRNVDLGNLTGAGTSTPVQFPMPLPASVTVAAAAKGPFVPTEDLLRNKGLHGWKGSAATSAFRPAGKPLEGSVGTNNIARVVSNTRKQSRLPLDIDLNVPDERVVEDLASRTSGQTSVCDITNNLLQDQKMGSVPARPAGGLDLDLNKVDETTELENYTSNNHKLDTSFETIKQASIGRMTDEAVGRRDFDLNNGPMIDDVNPEQSIMFGQHAARSSLPSQPSLPGTRVNGADMGNFSSWFPSASYSATVPLTAMPDRDQPFSMVVGGGPQRFLGATTAPHSFNPDLYRGPVLSSSPAIPFQATAPFQYPVFPFGGSFPLSSATFSGGSATYVDASSVGRLSFPTVNSQLSVSSNYPRPYVVNLTDGNSSGSGSEAGRKWFRQDLDLNNGPGIPVTEGRKEASSLAPSRPMSASSSQTLAEEQARIFQMASGVVKRKEPEGGWDGYKQSSWH